MKHSFIRKTFTITRQRINLKTRILKTIIRSILLGILPYFLLSGCEKNPVSVKNDIPVVYTTNGAFVVNEGSFTAANASLCYFDMDSLKIYNNVYFSVNNQPLGSVANSITIMDTLVFIVVNNSDKIEVISANSFKRIATIALPSGSSPRNLAISDQHTGYVSNLYTNSCSIIDLSTWQVTGKISVGANPEEVVIANSKLYVANSGFGYGNSVSVISLATNQNIKTIFVGDNPIAMEADENGSVFVLCSGSYGDFSNPLDDTPGGLWHINPQIDQVSDSLIIAGHPMRLALTTDNRGYFINAGVISEFRLQPLAITNNSMITGNFYGLNYDIVTKQIFALDPKDYFSQNGELFIYNEAGTELGRYQAGLIPGTVGFYHRK